MTETHAGMRFEAAVPVERLFYYPGNARRGDVEAVADSLRVNGQFRPLVVQQSTGYVLGGNHTMRAGREELCRHCNWLRSKHGTQEHREATTCEGFDGWQVFDVTWLDVTDEQARRIVLADNRTSDLATYDDEALAELLRELDGDLEGTGYIDDDLAALEALIAEQADDDAGDPEDEDAEPTKGDLLALADVAVAEPNHHPTHGSCWRLGQHLLVVARVADEHHLWAHKLSPERVFCPYPEPYITASELAQTRPLLLVQPNRYLAGHLIDKHEAVYPGTVEQV